MRRRKLPLAAEPGKRHLPLAPDVRAVDRQAQARYAVWEITLRCDLACKHCGSRAGKARADELTTDEALGLVDQLAELGVNEITLIGGEVYLREDWDRIARHIREHGIVCGIVTGGRGFTRAIAERAKAADVSAVGVSIDGLEATHDDVRGKKGSFAAALETLEHLRSLDIARAVNTQINKRSLHEIEQVFELVADFGIYGWQTQFTVAMGRAADNAALLLEPYQLIEVMPVLARLAERARARGIRFAPGNNVGYFGPYEGVFRGNYTKGHHEPCSAGSSTMGIEADGAIKGCPSLPTEDYAGGNIREHSLREIWERAPALRFTRGRTTDDLWGFCQSCYYAEACLAGCSWTSHVLSGRRGNNPYCHHRALELLDLGKRERVVRTQAPRGAPFDYGAFQIVEEPCPPDELSRLRAIASQDP